MLTGEITHTHLKIVHGISANILNKPHDNNVTEHYEQVVYWQGL